MYTTSENSGCLLSQTRDGYWRYSLNHTGDVQWTVPSCLWHLSITIVCILYMWPAIPL